LQHRRGADLDENSRATVDHAGHRIAETHWLARVAPPVEGIELADSDLLPGYSGDQRLYRGVGRDRLERRHQRQPDRVHVGAVERVGEIEADEDPSLLERQKPQRLYAFVRTRHRDRRRGVDRGYYQVEPARCDHRGCFGFIEAERRHRTGAVDHLLRPAARHDHQTRFGQRQRAAGPGGRHLAHGVADMGGGLDPPRP